MPTAKGYFSGCGGMELRILLAGVKVVQSLDLDPDATECMNLNPHYFSHAALNVGIKDKTVLEQPSTDIIVGKYPCTKYSTIGTRRPFSIAEPTALIKRPRLKDILEKNPQVEMPEYVLSRIKGKYRDKPIIVDPEHSEAIAPTCVAHYSKDLGTRLVKDRKSKHGLRPFSIREYARLQGFPDDFHFQDKRTSYKLIGNAVPVHMGKWIGEVAVKYFN